MMCTVPPARRCATINRGCNGVTSHPGGGAARFLTGEGRMPAARMISELDSGAELLVHYALLDGTQWQFQDAQLISARSQLLNTYPSYAEATAVLGSELRPTLARLKAVL